MYKKQHEAKQVTNLGVLEVSAPYTTTSCVG